MLPRSRQEKLLRLKQDGARRLSLGAGLLLHRALSDQGLAPGEIALGPRGKPFFPALTGLCFSLSHSGETVLCALSDRELGCDAEVLGRPRRELAARFFHERERRWLSSLPPEEEQEGFFRLWTLKESYVKATGQGLSRPLNSFAVDMSGPVPLLRDTPDSEAWQLLSLLEGDCACALCCARGASPALCRVESLP